MNKIPTVKKKERIENNMMSATVKINNSTLLTKTPKKRQNLSSTVYTSLRSNLNLPRNKKLDLTKPLNLGRSATKV